MLKPSQIESIRPQIKVLQIICGALILGVLLFLGVISLALKKPINQGFDLMTLLGIGFAVLAASAAFVVPVFNRKQAVVQLAREEVEPDTLLSRVFMVFQTSKIIWAALLEGPAFFNTLAWMMESSVVSLGVLAVLLSFMAIGFPSEGRTIIRLENMMDDYRSIRSGR